MTFGLLTGDRQQATGARAGRIGDINVHNAAVWTFANHTEQETVYEWVDIVIGIVGVIAIFQLHQWWGYVLFVLSFVISIPIGRRAIRRRQHPPQ